MSKDTSLEDIDIAKLLLYILLFLIVCLVMVFVFIMPNIKEYREIAHQNRAQAVSIAKINQTYSSKTAELNEMKERERAVFEAFKTKFDKANFSVFASKFFEDVKLVELDSNASGEKFFRYELNVTTSIKTPGRFYQFINALQKYTNIIKVDFPINMHGKDGKIHTTFNIKVYAEAN